MTEPLGGRYPIRYTQIELTSRCNLQCVECPHRLMQRKPRDISEEVLEAAIEKVLLPYPMESLIVSMSGEPLLNRDWFGVMGRLAEVHAGPFEMYTNGLLYTRNHHDFLAGLPNRTRVLLTFHLYGATGRRIDYGHTASMLHSCLESPAPNVEYILSTHATHLAPESELQEWHAHWETMRRAHSSLAAVHLNRLIATWAGKVEGNTPFPQCIYRSGSHLFIGCTGNVLPCCADMEEELTLGNLLTDGLPALMERRAAFYDDVAFEAKRMPLCRACLPPGDTP